MSRPLLLLTAALVAAHAAPVVAEKADRTKPLVIEADQQSTADLLRQVAVFSGNVLIAQGTMQIRADRVEVRESRDGYVSAVAVGRPATYRQRRDGPGDEYVEGEARRIEFDGRANTLRLSEQAAVRLLRAGRVAQEITGSQISWDNDAELFRVQGGAGNVSPTNPTGRVRLVLTPPEAAAPASAPGAPLRPTPGLGERR